GRPRQTGIVILILTSPVHNRADIQALHPCVRRAIIEDTEVGAMPRQRTRKSKSRGQKLAIDADSLHRGASLKLSPRQPGAIDAGGQSAKISVAKDRGIQNIDRFIVEALEDRPRQVLTRI